MKQIDVGTRVRVISECQTTGCIGIVTRSWTYKAQVKIEGECLKIFNNTSLAILEPIPNHSPFDVFYVGDKVQRRQVNDRVWTVVGVDGNGNVVIKSSSGKKISQRPWHIKHLDPALNPSNFRTKDSSTYMYKGCLVRVISDCLSHNRVGKVTGIGSEKIRVQFQNQATKFFSPKSLERVEQSVPKVTKPVEEKTKANPPVLFGILWASETDVMDETSRIIISVHGTDPEQIKTDLAAAADTISFENYASLWYKIIGRTDLTKVQLKYTLVDDDQQGA